MLPDAVVAILMPVLVFGATWVVKKVFSVTNGAVIVSVIVPLLSLAGAWIATVITPDLTYWVSLGLNLTSVFISQLLIQFNKPEPNKKSN